MWDGSDGASYERGGDIRRRLFNLAAALSLVLCVGIAALWVLSFWTAGSMVCNVWHRACWAFAERNLIRLEFHEYREGDEPNGVGFYANPDYAKQSGLWDELRPVLNPPVGMTVNGRPFNRSVHEYLLPAIGLGYRRTEYPNSQRVGYRVYVPHWLAALAFALLPTVWYVRVGRPRWRYVRGCCVHCGYDLRATPERCPECGAKPQAAVGAAA